MVRASAHRVVAAMPDADRGDGVRVRVVEAAPGDDLVGSDERERGLIEVPRLLRRHVDDLELDTHAARGIDEALASRRCRAEPQKRPLEAEGVEERATLVQPD